MRGLGGGGGGSAKTGAEFGDLAVRFSQLELTPLDQIDPETVVVTASMVGAPAAQEKFVSPADMMRCVELFTQSTGIRPGGIVTNENGGGSTFNGWLEASMLGIPLIDAPCNGRAHPTGVMGSLNLHRDPNYITTMTCVGGRKELGRHVECTVTGSIDHCSKLVRAAAVEAGGLVAVIRNPVKASFLQKNSAVGGLSLAIETGRRYSQGLEKSVENGVQEVCEFLGGEILAHGPVEEYQLRSEGGFDVGVVKIGGYEMSFWNEYIISMTLMSSTNAPRTLPVGLLNLMQAQQSAAQYGTMYAGLVLVMLPTLILYICVQKQLTQGMTVGGLKG